MTSTNIFVTSADGHDEGCRDYGLTRRALLAGGAALGAGAAVTQMFGDVLTQTVYGATNDNVLVVLSLRGGADGLSMLVPYQESAYYSTRPGISVERSTLLATNGTFGLHPSFASMSGQFGRLAAIHAVGLPAPNRSHFSAMEELEEANPGSDARIGWLNRMIGGLAGSNYYEGVQIGQLQRSTALMGPAASMAVDSFESLTLPWTGNPRVNSAVNTLWGSVPGELGDTGRAAITMAAENGPVAAAQAAGPKNGATYPSGSLGDAFANSAALVRSGLGVKAIAVDYGGWDNHVGLKGKISSQITEMAGALNAFFTDLGSDASRVTLVTLSEFGRRLVQNGSAGTDHGYGNVVFVMGAGVKPGYYARQWPGLNTARGVDSDLAMTSDYRDVLSDILEARFPQVSVPQVFPGLSRASKLGFISG